jgi:alpha-amylase
MVYSTSKAIPGINPEGHMSPARRRPTRVTLRLLLLPVFLSASSLFAGVMMEGFYWNCPGPWYPTMQAEAGALANVAGGYGIDRIWFPVPQKSASGGLSMGYDPFDYYDVGSYSQNGGPGTHFGTQAQLRSAIAAFKGYGISCIADTVLNHRSGGLSESNGYTHGTSYTDFANTQSGMCQWHWGNFHPNACETSDEGTFGGYPDIYYGSCASSQPDIQAWMEWLQNSSNAGFDGWRYDYVLGYHPWVVQDMNNATKPTFSVGEYWDSNTGNVNNWVNTVGNSSAFDFALYYTMQAFCNDTTGGGNIANILNPSLSYAAMNPTKAVTFCANHDTDQIITDKMIAYAIILTYQGYPCIFWHDYFEYGLATGGGSGSGWGNGINQLLWCREDLAGGAPDIQILESSNPQVLVYGSYGHSASEPGYIVIINTNPSNWEGVTVTTGDGYLKNQTLKAYAWSSTISGQNYAPENKPCDGSGNVTVYAAPRGYAVYSVNGL